MLVMTDLAFIQITQRVANDNRSKRDKIARVLLKVIRGLKKCFLRTHLNFFRGQPWNVFEFCSYFFC